MTYPIFSARSFLIYNRSEYVSKRFLKVFRNIINMFEISFRIFFKLLSEICYEFCFVRKCFLIWFRIILEICLEVTERFRPQEHPVAWGGEDPMNIFRCFERVIIPLSVEINGDLIQESKPEHDAEWCILLVVSVTILDAMLVWRWSRQIHVIALQCELSFADMSRAIIGKPCWEVALATECQSQLEEGGLSIMVVSTKVTLS